MALKTRVRVVSLRSFDPLISGLSPRAFRAWQRALDWSCFHATNGLLSAEDIQAIGAKPAQIEELFARGVWQRDEHGRTFVAELRNGPVVADVEGCEVKQLSPGAKRQREWRARKRNTETPKRLAGDVSETRRDAIAETPRDVSLVSPLDPPSDLDPSGSESSPDPESSPTLSSSSDLTGSARVQRNRRRTALPADWKPTKEHTERASKTGLNLERETLRFRTHHEAKGSLMANWNAAFTTWLLNAVEFARPPGAVQHEKTRQDEAKRPYHELFKPEPEEMGLDRTEALQAVKTAMAGIGRRL